MYSKEILVLGCGNVLWGDDGFGPMAAEYLEKNYTLPENVFAGNAELSVRGILFNVLLSEKKPKKIIIIDAIDAGRKPGEVFIIRPEELPSAKTDDFSMHQAPTSNLLREIKDAGIDVVVVSCQVEHIPEEISSGLSDTLKNAIEPACDMVMEEIMSVML